MSTIKKIEVQADVIESFAPGSGRKLGQVFCSTPAEVGAVVARARQGQKRWEAMGVAARNRILRRLKGVLIDRAEDIASTVSAENGKPRCEALGMVLPICAAIDFYTGLAGRVQRGQRVSSTFFFGSRAEVHYQPLGVVGLILPWNFPFELGMKHVIPALAAGNAAVQKPSEQNPLIGELVAELFHQAGVPNDVVQMVHGYGDVGAALIDHTDVVCFVGSPRTGRKVMARAAETLTPVVLELGGNDPAIVRADADVDLTARGLVNGTCFNSGQVCNGIERIYVARQVAEPLIARIEYYLGRLRQQGEGAYDVGPVSWRPQLEIYRQHTADALEKGATLHAGGEVLSQGDGQFWPPTLLSGMTQQMKMMQEETFGPFLPLMIVDSDEQALRLANDSQYGLGASVWTRDQAAGQAMALKLKAGSVMINNAVQSGGCVTLPFGGEGESGVGRVQGEAGFFNYLAAKSVMRCPSSVKSLWMPYNAGVETMVRGLTRALHGRSLWERVTGVVDALRNWPRGG